MVELMTATGWSVGQIASIADVTSSAVSQWVGNGKGKQSKSIGNIAAAMKLEKESGFSALWLAQGKGPKLADKAASAEPAEEPQTTGPQTDEIALALAVLAKALALTDEITRAQVTPLLSMLANDPAKAGLIAQRIADLLGPEPTRTPKQHDGDPVWSGSKLPTGGFGANEQRGGAQQERKKFK